MQENRLYGKFRNKRHPFAYQLMILFKDVVVARQFDWALSSGTFLSGLNEMEKGFWDSEDVSAGATEKIEMSI